MSVNNDPNSQCYNAVLQQCPRVMDVARFLEKAPKTDRHGRVHEALNNTAEMCASDRSTVPALWLRLCAVRTAQCVQTRVLVTNRKRAGTSALLGASHSSL